MIGNIIGKLMLCQAKQAIEESVVEVMRFYCMLGAIASFVHASSKRCILEI